MEQNSKKNFINVYTAHQTGGLKVSACDTRQVISATNNRAQYFAEQAQKYRDEAKQHRDNAKYYAEQNSDVTFEYIDSVKNSLLGEISTKQPAGEYALKDDIPINISELSNDKEYTTQQQLLNSVPSQENCDGMFLYTNGESTSWKGINSFSLFDTKLSDHILNNEETKGWALQGTYVYKEALAGTRYGYPDFYNKVIEEYGQSTNIETVNGVEVRVNSNGHKFYDIANKTSIDEFFDSMGSAWFYGVDTENERVFLPRNSYFEQASTTDVGQSVEAGLPNITAGFHSSCDNTSTDSSGAFSTVSTGSFNRGTGNYSVSWAQRAFDASRSSDVYGNSNTVQPNAVKKLLYICVGNTTNYEGITDVVNQGMDILEQVAQKVNVDGTNLNAEGKSLISSYAMPSSKYIDLAWGATGTKYTAPANGWVYVSGMTTTNMATVTIENITAGIASRSNTSVNGWGNHIYIPVRKGDVFSNSDQSNFSIQIFRFIYAEGEV